MRADLHTHTVFSDGELIPAELVRRAMVLGHDMIAITDHVDMTNVEFVASNVAKAVELCEDYIRVIPGVEITHVPPSKIDHVAKLREEGAFSDLRGLVYFTDGMGIYPKTRPPYETAFILLEEPPLSVRMPPWAIRLVLPVPALERAVQQAAEDDGLDLDELPQL